MQALHKQLQHQAYFVCLFSDGTFKHPCDIPYDPITNYNIKITLLNKLKINVKVHWAVF